MFSWLDLIVLFIIVLYAIDGFRRGFIKVAFDVVGIFISFIIALKFYNFAGSVFASFGLNQNFTKIVGFLSLWVIFEIIFFLISLLIFHYIPKYVHLNRTNKWFGILPGILKGIMIVSILIMILMVLPFSADLKEKMARSFITGKLIKSTAKIENQLETVLGQLNTLTFMGTVQPKEGSSTLPFRTTNFSIDEQAEIELLRQVNNERGKVGLQPLASDLLIRNVARAHSMDMLRGGYFAHENPAGQTPFDRLVIAGVIFQATGENLALAPTVDIAHIGLMNSPRHRDNILDADFSRVGIGVIDAGYYGKMMTQDFAD
ncbi:MAG: CvpA family protein [Patescibacteria group bacterium]